MSSSKSSHASSFEHDFETDIDEDENPDPGSTRRQCTMELDSDEESKVHNEFEAFFRQRRVPKRQREATPSSPSCSDSDDEQFYCRVQAQSASRRRQRREMELPIRNQNYQPLDLEQPTSPTIQNLEHQSHVDPHYTSDDVSVSGERLSTFIESSISTSESDDNGMLEDAYDEGSEEEMSEFGEYNATEGSFIFENSSVSVNTFNHLFLGVAEKHGLSGKVQSDLLDLFNITLPEVNNIPKSIFLFNKTMSHLNYKMENYAVCSSRQEEIITITKPVCSNDDCQKFHQEVQPFKFAIIDILPYR